MAGDFTITVPTLVLAIPLIVAVVVGYGYVCVRWFFPWVDEHINKPLIERTRRRRMRRHGFVDLRDRKW